MTTVSQLHSQAMTAYQTNQMQEALLLFRQAAGEAAKLGDRAAWFENMIWAAASAYEMNNLRLAQHLLLDALTDEPPDRPAYEAFIGRKLSLSVAMDTHPLLSRLTVQLEALRAFSRENPVPPADLESLAAHIEFQRGRFALAREGYERAWQIDEQNAGYIREDHACWAAQCCLALHESHAVKQWIEAIEEVDSAFHNTRKRFIAQLRLQLALLDDDGLPTLRHHLRTLNDAVASVDNADAAEERLRVELLDPDAGDPGNRAHPGRRTLTRKTAGRWDVHIRFDRWLAILDYRLATLRHAVGIPPVDDLYYTRPQQIPPQATLLVPESDLARRLHRLDLALRRALTHARQLDDWLECDWHQQRIEARRERIQEIRQAIATSEPTNPRP